MGDTYEGHALFLPMEPGDEEIRPVCLTVDRERPYRESSGRTWEPDEIPDEDALRELFGPGTYYVRARNAKRHVLAARRFVIRGPGVPLALDGSRSLADPSFAPPGPAGGTVGAQGPSTDMAMLLAFMKETRSESAQQLQSLMAVERERSQTMIATIVELSKATIEASTRAAEKIAAAPPASTVDPFEKFQEGMAFATELQNQLHEAKAEAAAGGGAGDELERTLMQLAGGWMAANGVAPPGAGGAPPAPPAGEGAA